MTQEQEIHAHMEIRMKDSLRAGAPATRQILDWMEDHLAKELAIWGFTVHNIHIVEVSQDSVI